MKPAKKKKNPFIFGKYSSDFLTITVILLGFLNLFFINFNPTHWSVAPLFEKMKHGFSVENIWFWILIAVALLQRGAFLLFEKLNGNSILSKLPFLKKQNSKNEKTDPSLSWVVDPGKLLEPSNEPNCIFLDLPIETNIQKFEGWIEKIKDQRFFFSKIEKSPFGDTQWTFVKNKKLETSLLVLSTFLFVFGTSIVLVEKKKLVQAKISVEENESRSSVFLNSKNRSPSWVKTHEFRNHFEVPFSLEVKRVDEDPKKVPNKAWLNVYEENKLQLATPIEMNQKVSYGDYLIRLSQTLPTGKHQANIIVKNAIDGTSRKFSKLTQNTTQKISDLEFEILRIEPNLGHVGSAVQIQVKDKKFWLFENFPKYNEVQFKSESVFFYLEKTLPSYLSEFTITKKQYSWIGALFVAISFLFWILKFFFGKTTFQILWNESYVSIVQKGNSMSPKKLLKLAHFSTQEFGIESSTEVQYGKI